jgi:predicted MFS family arabinose efflux permease
VTQLLIREIGWRAAFGILGVMALTLGLPVTGMFVRERGSGDSAHPTVLSGATVREGLRSRVFWLIVVVLFIASISQNAAITHLPALLTDRGVTSEQAALALSAMGIASLFGRLITGYLLDRFFAPYVSVGLLLVSAAGVYLLSAASSFAEGSAAAALIGVGMGGETDVTPYLVGRYLGLRSFSTLYGLTWTAYAVAGAAGPVMMGRVFDATHSYGTFLMVVAASTLLAAAANLAMPRYPATKE